MRHGVYTITCKVTGKTYVGSAMRTTFRSRWAAHRCELRSGKHHSVLLQRAWNKYGEDAFVFEVVEECDPGSCLAFEQYWMNALLSYIPAHGFNVSPVAENCYGVRHTAATREKLSRARQGKNLTEAHCAAIRAGHALHQRTAEHTAILAACHPSRKDQSAWRAMMAEAHSHRRRGLEAVDIRTGEVRTFASYRDAMRAGFDGKSIKMSVEGQARQHKGFRWRLMGEASPEANRIPTR